METYHQNLHELSNRISADTLDNLKYLCQDALSEAKLDSVKTPLDLFTALEEQGKISANNTEYLVELLRAEGKPELEKVLVHGSLNVICEESSSAYSNITQQLVYSQQYQSAHLPFTSQSRYQPQLINNHHSLHVSEAFSPSEKPEYYPRDQLSWEENVRGSSAQRYSESLPLYAHNFAQSPSVDPVRTPSNHWQGIGNLYDKQITSEQGEFARYRSESVSAQSFHECSFEISHSYVSTASEGYQSAPSASSLPAQQIDTGWQTSGNQTQRWSNSSTFSTTHSTLHVVNQHEELPLPTPVEDDDDAIPYTNKPGHVNNFSKAKRDRLQHEHQICVLNQEISSLREQCNQMQQYIKKMQQQQEQMIEKLRTQCISVGERYQMDKSPHGIAVIINNYKFHSINPTEKPMSNRRGSLVDENSLYVMWTHLGYNVHVLKNCTASKLLDELKKVALQSHNAYDSFVCCILSHGYCDGVYGADGQQVKMKDIINLFEGRNSPTLFGKPKMFFIQACRGDDEDQGVFPQVFPIDEIQKDGKDDINDKSLPCDADFLLAYSTASGKASYRSQEHGSWYISILCQVFEDHAHFSDLLSMLTIVNDKVSKAYTSKGYKQCPAPVFFLRKQVWFFEN